jgi:hypothetical protein
MNQEKPIPEWIGTLLDPNFKYNPAAKTDVQRTWRKYGWIPPSELREQKNESNAGVQLPRG